MAWQIESSTGETLSNKDWVMNMSDKELTPAQSVLSLGLNFAVSPDNVPWKQIVASIEKGLVGQPLHIKSLLQSKLVGCIRSHKTTTTNVPKSYLAAIRELQKDRSIVILSADKGNRAVVMNRTDYTAKLLELLKDARTYKKLARNPTPSLEPAIRELQKDRSIVILSADKGNRAVVMNRTDYTAKLLELMKDARTYKKLARNPTPSLEHIPLRAIVSFIGSPSYMLAKFLAKIVAPLIGNNSHHVRNSHEFAAEVRDMTIADAMGGSPISVVIANVVIETIEEDALATFMHPPRYWKRYVDDTFAIIAAEQLHPFLGIEESIQFTLERENEGKIAFLDVEVSRDEEGGMKTYVYRKPTHTNRYLSFWSAHPIEHKKAVVRSLKHRAEALVSDPLRLQDEMKFIKDGLRYNSYPPWMVKWKPTQKPKEVTPTIATLSLPYVPGLSDTLKRMLTDHGIK
uniref:uncharacterized protein LOC108950552 n=1 Tax=Ciona intestinalis TaxID=7719 RepID=UPI0002B8EE6C